MMNVCIVGAGIFGMAAALELRRRGHEVTLVERGEIPNPEASSTDVSKVIRRTMYPNEIYVELVTRAAAQWREWHERTSRSIYFQTGKLIAVRGFGPEHEALAGWETLSRLGKDVSELSLEEVQRRFPQFAVSAEDRLFHDPWAGYLRSGQALADLAGLAREAGVAILENTQVTAVEETASGARVQWASESRDWDRVDRGRRTLGRGTAAGDEAAGAHHPAADGLLRPEGPRPLQARPFPRVVDPLARQPLVRVPAAARGLREGGRGQQGR